MQLRNNTDPGQSEVLFSNIFLEIPPSVIIFACFNGKFSQLKYGVFSNNLKGMVMKISQGQVSGPPKVARLTHLVSVHLPMNFVLQGLGYKPKSGCCKDEVSSLCGLRPCRSIYSFTADRLCNRLEVDV